MPLTPSDIESFRRILPPADILTDQSPDYKANSLPWSLSYDKSPSLILRPADEGRLQECLQYLYQSRLDFAIRSGGCGSSSAEDVILSLRAFSHLRFDHEKETVEIGAGLDWGQVDVKLASAAPGYSVVGPRCPYVGVGGSLLAGGFSWLSHEFGLGSDPQNLLDVRMALADGRVIWASEEPELLWALRGAGGNFGVAISFRLQARRYRADIYSGMVSIPASSVEVFSKELASWVGRCHDPRMALHVFVQAPQGLHGDGMPTYAAMPFDGNGYEHGLSEDGFKWLLDIPGAQHTMEAMDLCAVHELQRGHEALHGLSHTWMEAALVPDPDEDFLLRARDWYIKIARDQPDFAFGTFALMEIMQKPSFCSSGSPGATAWPHGDKGRQHVLQLCTGGSAQSKEHLQDMESVAMDILRDAPGIISNREHPAGDFLPNCPLPNHDLAAIYGENWDRIRQLKTKYDPHGRFNKGIIVPPL